MQCFQKDPNLRVSARKLLKHPWIVNARRSDAVVPKKPTEYEEAIKSVQQWNEALKSPNASLRRASRPMSSSPIPGRREPPAPIITPAKGNLTLAKPRLMTDQFRSPETASDDNWDDDFASSISPSVLRLPHLRPQDNFGGMLSSEKLKAFASFESVTEEADWNDNFEGNLTIKSPMKLVETDPLETIRPYYPKRADTAEIKHTAPTKSPERKVRIRSVPRAEQAPAKQPKPPMIPQIPAISSTMLFRENSVEDFSDLIVENEDAFDRRTISSKVRGRNCSSDQSANIYRTLMRSHRDYFTHLI